MNSASNLSTRLRHLGVHSTRGSSIRSGSGSKTDTRPDWSQRQQTCGPVRVPTRVRFKDRSSTTNMVIRNLARRIRVFNSEIREIDRTLTELISETAPSLFNLHGIGTDTAASLLVAAGDNPDRLHSERSWAHLCGVTPLPASSGKVIRHRLNRGGDRQANAALYRIVLTRMSSHQETRTYVARRREEGLSTPEIIRCLKRYVARQTYKHLTT